MRLSNQRVPEGQTDALYSAGKGCVVAGLSQILALSQTAQDLNSRIDLIAELIAAAHGTVANAALVFRVVEKTIQVQEIAGALTVGSGAGCDLRFSDRREMSGRHFRIIPRGEAFVVQDCGSRNGTKINGIPVTRRELCDGDLIKAGGLQFLFLRKLSPLAPG